MANTILAFDELDTVLGSFFQSCKENLDSFFAQIDIQPTFLNSNKLNDLAIEIVTKEVTSFVFGAYSHGGNDCLLKSASTPYISRTNSYNFKKSFFYTFSCSSGKELGADLIDNGCHCYIGYKDIVAIWSTYPKPFIECANYGLIQFFNGEESHSIINQMKDKYNKEIDKMYRQDFLIASILMENRDGLILLGNNISLVDFYK
jgi:hypothetical protein